MGASATLPDPDPTATNQPSDPGAAWSARAHLKEGEWQFRRGMLDDAELQRRRDALRAADPRFAHRARWAQPTVAELRAAGDHAEADRILGERRWYDTQRAHARREEAFTQLNPDFAVLPDDRDPGQHQFAADREQALALGTRVVEGLRGHNHPDPQRRERAVAGVAVEARFRAAGYDQPTRQQAQRVGAPDTPGPLPQQPEPERARGGPER